MTICAKAWTILVTILVFSGFLLTIQLTPSESSWFRMFLQQIVLRRLPYSNDPQLHAPFLWLTHNSIKDNDQKTFARHIDGALYFATQFIFNIPTDQLLLSFMPHFELAMIRRIFSSWGRIPVIYHSLHCNCMKFSRFKTHLHVKGLKQKAEHSRLHTESLKHLTMKLTVPQL